MQNPIYKADQGWSALVEKVRREEPVLSSPRHQPLPSHWGESWGSFHRTQAKKKKKQNHIFRQSVQINSSNWNLFMAMCQAWDIEVKNMNSIRLPKKHPGSAPGCVALHKLFCALDFLFYKMVMIITSDSHRIFIRRKQFYICKVLRIRSDTCYVVAIFVMC